MSYIVPANTTANCMSPHVNPTAACWDYLNVSQYLDDWWKTNEATCNESPYQGDGFGSCYQQLHGVLDTACSNVSLSYMPNLNFSAYTPQEYYVLQSMQNLWYWYSSIWFAAEDASLLTDLQAARIVQTINPVNPGGTSLGVLLSALSAGFAFLGIPAGLGTIPAKLAATAVGQSPGLAKSLLPTGSLDSEFTQLGEIESALETVLQQFQINLADTLNATLYSITNFQSLTAEGAFMATEMTSLNASTSQLKRVLSTFIVSQALQANNIIVTVAQNVSPYNLIHNLTTHANHTLPFSILPQNAWHVNCQDYYNDVGVCDNWWFDPVHGDAYALYKLDSMGENYYDLMNTMFRNGWTSGEDLFLGSMNCLNYRVNKNMEFKNMEFADFQDLETVMSYSLLSINATNLQTNCNANLRTCIWNQTNDATAKDRQEFSVPPAGYSDLYRCRFAWPDSCEPTIIFNDEAGEAVQVLPYTQVPFPAMYDAGNIAGWNSTNLTGVTNCHSNYDDLGWGGAGYHQSDSECNKYPASYLGPGLWLDTNFCGP